MVCPLSPMSAFDAIFGQPFAVESLRRAYLTDRLPHGLIFAGPAGVGKATTARALATLFLCERPAGDAPCGACVSCGVIGSGNHPDYHVITRDLIRYHDKTGKSKGIDLSINVLRPELIEPAGRKAVMGRGKAFVVEEAETMNPQAQNGLLKTLEEPAGRTIIVLLTDQPGALLPTIRSRCQTIRFAALSPEATAGELARRGIDRPLARKAAAYANGSLGVALKWIADDVIERADALGTQLDSLFAGRSPDDLPAWFKGAADAYAERQMARDPLGSKDQANREGLTLYLHLAAENARGRLSASDDPTEIERECGVIDAVAQAEFYLDANVSIPLVFQQLAATLEREVRVGA